MRKPMTARSTVRRLGLAVAVVSLLSACNVDNSIAPVSHSTTPQAKAPLMPPGANMALYGVSDGTYVVTFDPTQNQNFYLGYNHLSIPAYSVCNLVTSGYGTAYWNQSCSPQTLPVTLTVTIKNAQSDSPSVDFLPAMRFNPTKTVQLFMYVPHATATDAKNWLMLYCPTSGSGSGKCIDESLTDPTLTSYVDYTSNLVFRRVKHFSGYVIAGRDDSSSDGTSISGQ